MGGGDGGLPAGDFPQGEHVVGLFAVLGAAHGVDGRHPEAVRGEGLEVVHLEDSGVVGGLDEAGAAGGQVAAVIDPSAVLADADVDEVVADGGVVDVEGRCPGEVHGAGGEPHHQRFSRRVGNV